MDRRHLPPALRTPLAKLLGCQLPVMNAGMGGVARGELAAAVCNAGGFGCLGMVREPVARIREEVAALRARCDRPFAVNLIPAATDRKLLREQVAACLELEVPAIVLFWDVDVDLVRALKSSGMLVLHQVGCREDAERALAAGVDVLIAQGREAGGHVRGHSGTMVLVPELVRLSSVPVVASGGIATGSSLVAALALGAQGVSLGSLFLATTESNAHPEHQRRLCESRAEDTVYTRRFYINWPVNAPVRVLGNAVTRGEYDAQSLSQEHSIIAEQDGEAVVLFSTDSPLRGATGKLGDMALYAGESCSFIDSVPSVAQCMDKLILEACSTLSSLQYGYDIGSDGGFDVAAAGEDMDPQQRAELVAALRELLAAERSGARLARGFHAEVNDAGLRTRMRQLHEQEVSSCRALLSCLDCLGVAAGNEVSDFDRKVMALETHDQRMSLIDAGQRWVLKRVERLLPQVHNQRIRQQLEIVRRNHQAT